MYLGIDVGTSSLKAVLSDTNGKIIETASVNYAISLPHDG
jgi:sugar (pentulose or hexulose) kinase